MQDAIYSVKESLVANRLNPGERLIHGQRLSSPNSRFVLHMQEDGNLVIYAPGHIATWASNTDGEQECVVKMQEDGNLVVIAAGNRPVWASGTHGNPRAVVMLQDDGNLVIYAPGNRAIWHSGTHLRDFRLVVTNNGRIVENDSHDGVRVQNDSNQNATAVAGVISVNVPPGDTVVIQQINDGRPATVEVEATSRNRVIQVGQVALNAGDAIRPGTHIGLNPHGDVTGIEDNKASDQSILAEKLG